MSGHEDQWDPDEELALLVTESDMTLDRDPVQAVKQVFERHAVQAAKSICIMATSAQNERTRLQAATYVVDRVAGQAGATKDEFSKFLEGLVRDSDRPNINTVGE